MQPLGLLILISGVFVAYCGVYGIDPLKMALLIAQAPNEASDLLQTAKVEAAEQLNADLTEANAAEPTKNVGGGVTGIGGTLKKVFGRFTWGEGFGFSVKRGRNHNGVDIPMPVGTPLPALAAGTVSFGQLSAAAGNTAIITTAKGYKIRYLHCSRFNDKYSGKAVESGGIVAYSGGARGAVGAGNSTGPHLHIEVLKPDGSYMDPAAFDPKDA